MSRALVALPLALAVAGCAAQAAGPAAPPASVLERADDQMAAGQYRSALGLYDRFLRARPDDPAAARARATRTLVERLLASQSETERLRRELEARQAEIDGLRADLDRLRRIDLRAPQPAR